MPLTVSHLDRLIFFTHDTTFLFLELYVSHGVCQESISNWIPGVGVTLHLSGNQLNQALNSSNSDLRVPLLKKVEIPAEKIQFEFYLVKLILISD